MQTRNPFIDDLTKVANGAMGALQVNTVDCGGAQRLEITGDKAAIAISGDTLTITRYEPGMNAHRAESAEMFGRPGATTETLNLASDDFGSGHLALHQDFFDAIVHQRTPRVDGREGRKSLELANALLLSSDRNAPVTLPLDRAAYDELLGRLQGK